MRNGNCSNQFSNRNAQLLCQSSMIGGGFWRILKPLYQFLIIAWQNVMLTWRDEHGKGYSPTYLKTIHNQCSAIFNHAVRYYELKSNPAAKAGNMGKEKSKEMLFWTKPEYQQFSDAMMDKPVSTLLKFFTGADCG